MADKYWIISRGSLTYEYPEVIKTDAAGQNQLVYMFAVRSYIFEAYKDGEWDPPLSELTGTGTKFRVVCTDKTTAALKLPNLSTGFSGTAGVDYYSVADGGVYRILDKTKVYSPDTLRWTTFIKIAGKWDKGKRIRMTDSTRKIWA